VAAALCADNADLRFLIAGDGPLRAELTARIEALGWTGRIQVVDFVPDLAALVSDASLFLLTSDNEGTPNVLLEAMTAGVPCISFDIGSVPDILTGPLSADCIPFGDTPAMIARARHLLANPLLLQAEAAFSRQRIHDDFSLTVSMERFERLFLSLCGTPS
jgi:glycosyltransferase involved in cell wall biosynthesis